MDDFVNPDVLKAYKANVALIVEMKRGSFPSRWIATVRDTPGFLFVRKGFLTKRSALNFIEQTTLEYAGGFWSQ